MTTVLQARPRQFVSTPSVERIATRALRYLHSGYSIHLRGPAGTGKTTLAMHLADLMARPIMLLFGDDEYKTSDLIGNQSGYTRKKVVDNFIHSVVKMEDELKQTWVDSRLTLACREGFTLVYDEFNRSRPEVNNVLLSALEEKLLVLPPSGSRPEYIRVSPHFRGIFTSNPEEYCGVHGTQDALLDRLITINMPEPDELTQQEILVQKTEIGRSQALLIVRLVKAFQRAACRERASSLRASLMIAKVCQEHGIAVEPQDADFRDTFSDILLSRAAIAIDEAQQALWQIFNQAIATDLVPVDAVGPVLAAEPTPVSPSDPPPLPVVAIPSPTPVVEPELVADPVELTAIAMTATAISLPKAESSPGPAPTQTAPPPESLVAETSAVATPVSPSQPASMPAIAVDPNVIPAPPDPPTFADANASRIYDHLHTAGPARLHEIEAALGLNRFQTVNALKYLAELGMIIQEGGQGRPSVFKIRAMQ